MKYLICLLCLSALSACQIGNGPNGSPAPVQPSSSPSLQPSSEPSSMPSGLPGGYFEQNPADPEMLALMSEAEKLLQAKYPTAGLKLTKLNKIASQVVAGANYSIEADYTDSKGSGKVSLVLFRSLQGEYSLSSENYSG